MLRVVVKNACPIYVILSIYADNSAFAENGRKSPFLMQSNLDIDRLHMNPITSPSISKRVIYIWRETAAVTPNFSRVHIRRPSNRGQSVRRCPGGRVSLIAGVIGCPSR